MGLLPESIRRLLRRTADRNRSRYAIKVPNAATLEAMKELDEGKGTRFSSAEELFEDIGSRGVDSRGS